jgi:hypothetical protein
MKTTLLFLSVFISANLFGQNVNIPDANFKAYLVGNTSINTNGDTEIQVSEASAFTGEINCSGESISDLTGIEAFTALTQLRCTYNPLESLDVSSNTALTNLFCDGNQLTSLDVSSCTALTLLWCQVNQLECLNVKNGNNTAFTNFNAEGNQNLTCIEVDDVNYSTANWTDIDSQTSFSIDCDDDCDDPTVGINELTTTKNLIQILDMMGRETTFKPNTPLIYVYDDGSIEKVFRVEY